MDFKDYRTFSLALIAVLGTFIGCYLNMFDPSIWQGVVLPAIGFPAIRSGAHAVATAIKEKPLQTRQKEAAKG